MALVFKQGQSMTQDELFELANKAGIGFVRFSGEKNIEKIETFAKLVAQHEREACAKVCEDDFGNGALNLAAAIRARGQA
jgi:hypothetical protein